MNLNLKISHYKIGTLDSDTYRKEAPHILSLGASLLYRKVVNISDTTESSIKYHKERK